MIVRSVVYNKRGLDKVSILQYYTAIRSSSCLRILFPFFAGQRCTLAQLLDASGKSLGKLQKASRPQRGYSKSLGIWKIIKGHTDFNDYQSFLVQLQ